jgi:Tfp pilus assembly protein PilF
VVHLRAALALDSSQPMLWMHLGDTLNNLKQFKHAKNAYLEAVKRAPKQPKAHLHLADAYTNAKELVQASRHYKIAAKLAPNNAKVLVGLLQRYSAFYLSLVHLFSALWKSNCADVLMCSWHPTDVCFFCFQTGLFGRRV